MSELVSIDFFVVPTVRFEILYVLVVLHLERRQVLHFNATKHPTSQWTVQQLRETFAWEETPRYLMRDRDAVYGAFFRQKVKNMGIEEVVTAPRYPWQNPYMERINGSIRRDCLDHVMVLNGKHLKRILLQYFLYYHNSRTHLSLDMDCPEPRKVQPPEMGNIVRFPEVGGLHHRYERRVA
ncbi:MAG: transposase [Deltaproteobacteria bacterium]|nr:MAG: transposase [Deltaproteobacteria bacterium]